jgi:hypothetical protein
MATSGSPSMEHIRWLTIALASNAPANTVATDSTYTGVGYLNLTTRNGVVRMDNFGGGTLP